VESRLIINRNIDKHPEISASEYLVRVFGPGMINPRTQYKNLQIKDIPIMITDEGQLLCIPYSNEVKHIGITGMTGTLKSVFINSQMGWHYWLLGRTCLNLNDYQKETFEQSLPTQSYLQQLKFLNISPCPTPMVYVFPSTKSLEIENKDYRFPLIKMTLPLEEAVRKIENFYKLDKSKVYINNIIDELCECSSMEEITELIEEKFPEKEQKLQRTKLLNIFGSLFNNQIINVANPGAPAVLEYQDGDGNRYRNFTIQTLLRAGLVPSIQTSDLRTQSYFSAYMAFVVDTLYQNQYKDKFFRNKTISLFVDEIARLWEGDNGKLIEESLGRIGTNGRMARIGLIWSTQHYEKVPTTIRHNTKYLFISRKSDAKEVNEIRKDFDIPKSMDKDILNLVSDPVKGIFELVAVTTEKFVLYDLETGNRSYTSISKKGKLIPPMARHRVPGVEI
jgi:hypothetical protein